MNKLLVEEGLISNICTEFYDVVDNRIIFKKSGNYFLEYIKCNNVDITVEINSDINVILYELSFDNLLVSNIHYILNLGNLVINKFYNNKGVIENVDIDLYGINSNINYNFSNISILDEKYTININHNNKLTNSNISNRSVTLENSKVDFIINSNVPKDMVKCNLNQSTRVITFGDSNSRICPNMFIDCNDVMAKHGSVVGTVKDDTIFYLMSRGIGKNDAIKLIIKGFLFSNVSADLYIRSRVFKIIDMYWR